MEVVVFCSLLSLKLHHLCLCLGVLGLLLCACFIIKIVIYGGENQRSEFASFFVLLNLAIFNSKLSLSAGEVSLFPFLVCLFFSLSHLHAYNQA